MDKSMSKKFTKMYQYLKNKQEKSSIILQYLKLSLMSTNLPLPVRDWKL